MFFFHTQPHIKISTHGRGLWLMWKIRMNRTPELIKLCILASVQTLAGILPKGSKLEKNESSRIGNEYSPTTVKRLECCISSTSHSILKLTALGVVSDGSHVRLTANNNRVVFDRTACHHFYKSAQRDQVINSKTRRWKHLVFKIKVPQRHRSQNTRPTTEHIELYLTNHRILSSL